MVLRSSLGNNIERSVKYYYGKMFNSHMLLKFSESELMQILNDPHSCVSLKKCKRHIAIGPSSLGDITRVLRDSLGSLVTKYDTELDGIVLGYRKMKLLSGDGGILNDEAHIHLDVKAQFFVFKPEVGSTLTGIVEEKRPDHIGCLVHKVFNVSIPFTSAGKEKRVTRGQQITFKVDEVDFSDTLPFIKGTLISVGEKQPVCGSSSFMEQFDTHIKGENNAHKYLIQTKKKAESTIVKHENEDITAAEDLVPEFPFKLPTSILKKRDSGGLTPSKRISFGEMPFSDGSSGSEQTKIKPSFLSSGIDDVNGNEEEEEHSGSEKHKKKKKKKDKKESDKPPENVVNPVIVPKIKTEIVENEDMTDEATPPRKKRKKHLKNVDKSFLSTAQNEPVDKPRSVQNEQHPFVEEHFKRKKKRKKDHDPKENEKGSEAGQNLKDGTKRVKEKKKRKRGEEEEESYQNFQSPLANSTVLPCTLFPRGTHKRLKPDLLNVFSPIARSQNESASEEIGPVSSTQIEMSPQKRSNKESRKKSPSPSKILKAPGKEKDTTSKILSPTSVKMKVGVQNIKNVTVPTASSTKQVPRVQPKELLRKAPEKSSSGSDEDTSSSEPPDVPSFQNFTEKLKKETRVVSNSNSSSSELSDPPPVNPLKEKLLKTKSQRGVPNILKPAGSSSSSSEEEPVSSKTQRENAKSKKKSKKSSPVSSGILRVGMLLNHLPETEGKGTGKKKKSDKKAKRERKKKNDPNSSSLLSEKETGKTVPSKKKSKKHSKAEKGSKKKKKSKTEGKSTGKATSVTGLDSANVAAFAEMLLKKFTG